MALTITNLIDETNFKAGSQLKANDLNTAFNQPIKLTNALSLAIASFATGSTEVDLETITQSQLKEIYINALKDIKKLKIGNNEASIDFGTQGTNNDEPFLTLNSKYNDAKTTLKLTHSLISIYANDTPSNAITFNPTTSTVTASVFEGTASKVKTTTSTANTDYHIWFGTNNQLFKSDKIKFNPSTGTMKLNGTIDFGNGVTLSQSGFDGVSEMANSIKVTEDTTTNQWYYILFGDDMGGGDYYDCFYNDSLMYNPYSKTLKADYIEGIADKADQIHTSYASASKFYLTGVNSAQAGYKNAYYNPNVYVENGVLYASSFEGRTTSATNADFLEVNSTSESNDSFYLLFAKNTSNYVPVYYNSGIKINPNTKIITANINGNSTSATGFYRAKTISLTGMFTGSVSTKFSNSNTVYLPIGYAADYGIKAMAPNERAHTSSGYYYINVGNASCCFVLEMNLYNGGYTGAIYFNVSSKTAVETSVWHALSDLDFKLTRDSTSTSNWYLQWRRPGSTWGYTDNDIIGNIVIYRYLS